MSNSNADELRSELKEQFHKFNSVHVYTDRMTKHLLGVLNTHGEAGFEKVLKGVLMDTYTIGAARERSGKHEIAESRNGNV